MIKRTMVEPSSQTSSEQLRITPRRVVPLVPPDAIASRALVTVIAIMTFLASLTAGAAIMIFMTYFFSAESEPLHRLLTAVLSLVIGLVIFLILALDRPLIGYVSIDPSSFEDALTTMGGEVPP